VAITQSSRLTHRSDKVNHAAREQFTRAEDGLRKIVSLKRWRSRLCKLSALNQLQSGPKKQLLRFAPDCNLQ
jgi:hypothetical protein